MKPRQLYRSDDSNFTMLAETIDSGTAANIFLRDEHLRQLTFRCGDLKIGTCVIAGEVISEILRIENILAAMLNTISDEPIGLPQQ